METRFVTITYHECATRYNLNESDLRELAALGLVGTDPEADAIREKPGRLARIARLHHELGLSNEGIDIVLAMRRRLLQLQRELGRQQARSRQLEALLRSHGPTLEADDWL